MTERSCRTCRWNAGTCGRDCVPSAHTAWEPIEPTPPGVPPGSGGEPLVKHPRMDYYCIVCGISRLAEPWQVVGVRFPAAEKDPGRWYRRNK
jgi:hypothetical protein